MTKMAEKNNNIPKPAPAPMPKKAPEAKQAVKAETQTKLKELKNAAPAAVKKQADLNAVKTYVQKETKNLSKQVQDVKKYQKSTQSSVNFWTQKEREAKSPEDKAAAMRNLEKARMNKAEYDRLARNLNKRDEATRVRLGNVKDALSKGRTDVALDRAKAAADFATVDANAVQEARARAITKARLHNEGKLTESEVQQLASKELASLSGERKTELGITGGTKLAALSPKLDAASHEFRQGTTPTFIVNNQEFKVKPSGDITRADGSILQPGTEEYRNVVSNYEVQAEAAEARSKELLRSWSARQKDLRIQPKEAKELTRLIKDMASPFLTPKEINDKLYAFKQKGAKAVINAAKVRAPELRADAQKDFEESWYVMDKLLKDIRSVALAYGISLGVGAIGAGMAPAAAPAAEALALEGRAAVPLLNAASKPAAVAIEEVSMGAAPKLLTKIAGKSAEGASKVTAKTAEVGARGVDLTSKKIFQNELAARMAKMQELLVKGNNAKADVIKRNIEAMIKQEGALEKAGPLLKQLKDLKIAA
ncbi:hypothetical protein COW46_04050 [Candidatus Gracilibacteria bacterium CG17_big_fil_post_rev_8_21_14_2_50_48_13]|nr:MAG: hypothetical protein COW46_04050 [Candidatus Gracilibacteria bacterium CG17_big_fil_post_rev_8_21_14_2_50_48_13]